MLFLERHSLINASCGSSKSKKIMGAERVLSIDILRIFWFTFSTERDIPFCMRQGGILVIYLGEVIRFCFPSSK